MTPHHDHDHTGHSDGELVRVSGIKTETAERVLPTVPALHDVLIDHKAEFGYDGRGAACLPHRLVRTTSSKP
jgi:hypothetical protein